MLSRAESWRAPSRGQTKARSFGPGFFTLILRRCDTLPDGYHKNAENDSDPSNKLLSSKVSSIEAIITLWLHSP
jgi:hypothetical protein